MLTTDCVSCKDAPMMSRIPLPALIGLGLCLLLWGVASCDVFNSLMGTPMPNEQNCQYVPDVESCKLTADNITESCLHDCVMNLCTTAKIVCTEVTTQQCKTSTEDAGAPNAGFVFPHGQTCQNPWNEINWCQLSISPSCQTQNMVHELAHACGWHHDGGFGVPGNSGVVSCNK